ncbi:MAG TPA: hypothetical protein VN512_13200 [Clostridia bacterium]|nr:hypothetical protein [Clostridia bacterium]
MSELTGKLNAEQQLSGALNAQGCLSGRLSYIPGPPGPANVLSIGDVETGSEASASITGESPAQILNLVLPRGETGHGLVIRGTYATVEALEAAEPDPEQGWMYNVGSEAPYHVYMWDEELNEWTDQDTIQGPAGPTGESAYASAVVGGYTGTQSEFYADLAAMDGLAEALAAL